MVVSVMLSHLALTKAHNWTLVKAVSYISSWQNWLTPLWQNCSCQYDQTSSDFPLSYSLFCAEVTAVLVMMYIVQDDTINRMLSYI